jgi:CRP/FNR family transcriptional regulator
VVTLPAGKTVYRAGDRPRNYILVIEGCVRVQEVTESGNEILLYRVGAGEPCVLTTTCLLGGDEYPAEGVTERDTRAVIIPEAIFEEGVNTSPGFRQFVFSSYGRRLSELMVLVQSVAFDRMDVRLARVLLNNADAARVVARTHQELAAEIGTAREVVSRQLKSLERRGWLKLHRGLIEILRPDALRDLVKRTPAGS